MNTLTAATQQTTLSMAQLTTNVKALTSGITSGYMSTAATAGVPGAEGTLASPYYNLGGGSALAGLQIYSPGMTDPLYLYNQNKDLEYEELSTMPQFATGGPVTQTGPAIVDEGEWVLPKPVVQMLQAMNGIGGIVNAPSSGGTPASSSTPSTGNVGSDRVQVESTLLDMTTQRTSLEMNVISARQAQISSEMLYIEALNATMAQIAQMTASGVSGPAGSLESQFGQLYQTRGRYGSGGFRREYL